MTKLILPTYVTKLPSTGKNIEFKPFTVKEEKALLLALQDGEIETINSAIKNTVASCTFNKLDIEATPYYDIEYLYLKIRSKSIGEIIDLVGSCECSEEAKTKFAIDIDDVRIEPKPSKNNIVKIPDTQYTVVLRHPTIDEFALSIQDPENYVGIVSNCMVTISSEDEVMDWSKDEKDEFVQSMSPKQQAGVAEFLKDMPLVKIDTKYKCVSCGKLHEYIISGYESFFL
jgi:hypothetical protein